MKDVTLTFNLYEVVALLGLAQCVYILVFMILRANRLTLATIPFLFFITLALAFFSSAAESRWQDGFVYYGEFTWLLWTLSCPLSALLVLQIASVTKAPSLPFWGMFFLIPCAYLISLLLEYSYGHMEEWLYISGIVVGCISLLVIWSKRHFLNDLYIHKNGKERYWLIISLIVLNIGLLVINLLFVNNLDNLANIEMARNIIGISFVYVASTSLFRIYPNAVSITPDSDGNSVYLNDSEIDIAMKIEGLLHLEKVYQEPSYKRSDLARELDITDSNLSKIVNSYFEKSVPQLLNTYRVEDAKYLLKETREEVAVIAEEAGFNSIATFNRVFKEIEGKTPTEYRESLI